MGRAALAVSAQSCVSGLTGKPQALERFEHAPLGVRRQRAASPQRIGEEAQRPGRGDRGIELAQRAGRGIARIGEDLVAGSACSSLSAAKSLWRHVDLAADLDHCRHAPSPSARRGMSPMVSTLAVTFSPS